MTNKYYDSIIMGRKNIDAFDELVTKWLSGGGQIYLDSVNELNLKFFQ